MGLSITIILNNETMVTQIMVMGEPSHELLNTVQMGLSITMMSSEMMVTWLVETDEVNCD